jgi:CRISPR system Cascade subunit CasE
MYLSNLLINVGDNPDRPRPGRLWIRNAYRVHQRLCMAFPTEDRRSRDSEFLAPFAPGDFATQHVHVRRAAHAGFLFRIDATSQGRVVILVVSAIEPDWDYAFHNAKYLLAAPPQTQPLNLRTESGTRYRFRLLANAVFRARAKSIGRNGQPMDPKWEGKRLPVPNEDGALRNWLDRRAQQAGFRVVSLSVVQPGYVYFNKSREAGQGQRLRSVRYDGLLEVTDAGLFRTALIAGIGPAKAFGFGLLSICPVPPAGAE